MRRKYYESGMHEYGPIVSKRIEIVKRGYSTIEEDLSSRLDVEDNNGQKWQNGFLISTLGVLSMVATAEGLSSTSLISTNPMVVPAVSIAVGCGVFAKIHDSDLYRSMIEFMEKRKAGSVAKEFVKTHPSFEGKEKELEALHKELIDERPDIKGLKTYMEMEEKVMEKHPELGDFRKEPMEMEQLQYNALHLIPVVYWRDIGNVEEKNGSLIEFQKAVIPVGHLDKSIGLTANHSVELQNELPSQELTQNKLVIVSRNKVEEMEKFSFHNVRTGSLKTKDSVEKQQEKDKDM